MKKTTVTIISLIFLVISANPFTYTFAADTQEKTSEEYVVQKADSLWRISGSKLEDPFLWPKVWNVNPQIKNPDLIYPGTKLIIPSREELMASPAPLASPEPPAPASKKMPLSILKRKTLKDLPNLVFVFPEGEMNKYIVDRQTFLTSGWIVKELPNIGKIVLSEKGGKLVNKNEIVYLESYVPISGNNFFTFKVIKKIKHPVTGENMGYQLGLTGVLEVIETKAMHKAIVKSTFDEITVGDGLLPYKDMEPPLTIVQPQTPDISGHILESRVNSSISAKGDIIFLDKGSNAGIKVGDVFSAISEKPVKRSIGQLQVISIQPETSTAVIVKAEKEITVGEPWGQIK